MSYAMTNRASKPRSITAIHLTPGLSVAAPLPLVIPASTTMTVKLAFRITDCGWARGPWEYGRGTATMTVSGDGLKQEVSLERDDQLGAALSTFALQICDPQLLTAG